MAEHEKFTDVAPHGGFRRCSTHRCRNRAVWPGPRRGWPAAKAGGEGPVLRVVGAPSAGESPREPGGRGTEELAVGPSEPVVVALGVGIVVLTVVIFFSSRRRHTRFDCDWSSDVCSSD